MFSFVMEISYALYDFGEEKWRQHLHGIQNLFKKETIHNSILHTTKC